jgi:hypothetical protein
MLLLKVHPFENDAEVFGPEGSIRRFPRAISGSRTQYVFPDDCAAIHARWDANRTRLARLRTPSTRTTTTARVDVESRSAMVYEILFVDPQEARS